ncbi:MAG: LysR family transcriptional regulator [Polyangiaceae bacterium]|nr:LysR family transcriptional regulator [Polyangiaceae bacterium]
MEYQSGRTLEELSAFVAVVQARGFTAAARATRARKATLSQRVKDLEQRLGMPLLMRTTRALRLTDEGRAYFEHASRALASARDAEAVVLSAKAKPKGVLRVTTSASLAIFVLEGVVTTYLAKYPDVAVQLDTSERRIDLVAEGFDLAVRVGVLEDSSLIARRLGRATGGFYASPRYLAKRGEPRRPEELVEHDAIVIPKADGSMEWPCWIGSRTKSFPVRPRLVVTHLETAARAASAGVGLMRAPYSVVAPYLKKKQLVPILRAWTPPGLDVHAVFPPGGALAPKTRAFLDLLEECFAAAPDARAPTVRSREARA